MWNKITAAFALLSAFTPVLAGEFERVYRRSPHQCNERSTLSCDCPSGYTFGNSTTFGFIGARVKDIIDITGDYFSTDWLGIPTVSTQGSDNRVGALRWLNVTYSGSTYQLVEKLTTYDINADGSFDQSFDLANTPLDVPAAQGGGSFAGYWVSIHVQQVADNVTWMRWGVYRCVTGNPFQFTQFHETYMTKLSDILREKGKLVLSSSVPYSIGER